MNAADRINRSVLARLGFDPKAYANAMERGHLEWLQRTIDRPFDLDADDLVAIGAWLALTQRTKVTRAQAGAICAALRTGLRHEPEAAIWHIWWDNPADRWMVSARLPKDEPPAGHITLDLNRIRARLDALRRDVEPSA